MKINTDESLYSLCTHCRSAEVTTIGTTIGAAAAPPAIPETKVAAAPAMRRLEALEEVNSKITSWINWPRGPTKPRLETVILLMVLRRHPVPCCTAIFGIVDFLDASYNISIHNKKTRRVRVCLHDNHLSDSTQQSHRCGGHSNTLLGYAHGIPCPWTCFSNILKNQDV